MIIEILNLRLELIHWIYLVRFEELVCARNYKSSLS